MHTHIIHHELRRRRGAVGLERCLALRGLFFAVCIVADKTNQVGPLEN